MRSKMLPHRSVADYNHWQVAGRLALLAVFLMASSYCFLIVCRGMIKMLS
jgi:hypothetical protein